VLCSTRHSSPHSSGNPTEEGRAGLESNPVVVRRCRRVLARARSPPSSWTRIQTSVVASEDVRSELAPPIGRPTPMSKVFGPRRGEPNLSTPMPSR